MYQGRRKRSPPPLFSKQRKLEAINAKKQTSVSYIVVSKPNDKPFVYPFNRKFYGIFFPLLKTLPV